MSDERASAPLLKGSPELAPLLEVAIEHLNDAVLITEGDEASPRHIVYVNRAFTKMTGYTFDEAIGQTPDFTVGKDSDRAALARIQEARARKLAIREEILKYRKDGSPFWVEIDVVPVLDSQGKCHNYLGVMRETTDRKALQTRVLEADRLASLGTLVAGIAHEINNPLSYILANLRFVSEILGAPPGTGGLTLRPEDVHELKTALDEVELGAERVRRIVRDLRVFSRAEESNPEPVDLAEILEASIKLVRAEIGDRIFVTRDLNAVPHVMGDASRLGQVFVNLLLNAAQSIPAERTSGGRIDIVAGEASDFVRVQVTDNGVGIAPQNMGRIFQPFFTTKPVGVGTGLGLPICQSIVAALGGRIHVASDVGRGTTVSVELRAANE